MSATIPLLLNVVAGTSGATSATVTVPASGQAEDTKNLDILLNVTANTGGTSPTVQAEVQWSHDGTTWASNDTTKDQTAATAVGSAVVKEVDVKAPYFRVVTTFGGAPTNMTYSVAYRYTS